jgi:hypothetical protein
MSDIEYKNKYLKYKVKYINLKNELEQQEGGMSLISSGFKQIGENLKKTAQEKVQKVAAATQEKMKQAAVATQEKVKQAAAATQKGILNIGSTAFWSGHTIVFFNVEDPSKINFLQGFSGIKFDNNIRNYDQNPKVIKLDELKKDFGENLWYWSNKIIDNNNDKPIRKNIPILSNPLICKINNVLGVEDTVKSPSPFLDFTKPTDVINFIQKGIYILSNKETKDITTACSKLSSVSQNIDCKKRNSNNSGIWYGAWINFGSIQKDVLHMIIKQPSTNMSNQSNPIGESLLAEQTQAQANYTAAKKANKETPSEATEEALNTASDRLYNANYKVQSTKTVQKVEEVQPVEEV